MVAKEYPPGAAEQDPGVAEQPWGSLDMVLVDQFGNRLILTNASAPSSWRFYLLAMPKRLMKLPGRNPGPDSERGSNLDLIWECDSH